MISISESGLKAMGFEPIQSDSPITAQFHLLKVYGVRGMALGDPSGGEVTGLLQQHDIRISMDGQGCWRDNIFVERLWRSIKYEEVYLHAYASVSEAKPGIRRYLLQYNAARPHSSLADQTPDEAYFTPLSLRAAA